MLLTVAEAAKRRKTTKFSIYRWLKTGLKHQKLGAHGIIIAAKDLDAFKPRGAGHPFKSDVVAKP